MHCDDALYRLHFDDHQIVYQQIDSKALFKKKRAIFHRNCNLSFNSETAVPELEGERDFINRFQQSWAELSMNLVCRIDYSLSNFIFIQVVSHPVTLSLPTFASLSPLRELFVSRKGAKLAK